MEARVPDHPALDRGGLVGGIVVHHQMHVELGRYVGLDGVEELAELERAVAALELTDHPTRLGIQRGEQTGGSMPQVVVGAAFGLSRAHGQQGSGAFQCLNLALLVDTQDQGAIGGR